MDINTTYPTQNALASQLASAKPKAAEVDKFAEQKKPPVNDNDGDKDNSVARDSVELSSDALRLASTPSMQEMNNKSQIPDRQQVQQLMDQLVTGIQNQPKQAESAFGSISSAKVGALLA